MALAFTHQGTLYIVLDQENVARVVDNDPFDWNQAQCPPGMLTMLRVPLQLCIAYADKDEYARIEHMAPADLVKYLRRGYKVTATDHEREDGYKPL